MSTWSLAHGFLLLLDTDAGGGTSSTDWTDDEKAQIRHRLGIDGTATAPSATPSLAISTQVDALEGDVTTLLGRLTSTRASNLDNLDAAVSSRMATFTLPTNFSALAITVGGAVTAGTVSDKTGYSLTQSFPSNFSSLSITAAGRVDVAAVAGTAQTARDLGANLDAAVSTRLATAGYTAPDNSTISATYTALGAVVTDTVAIKTKTDQLTFTVSNTLDTNATYIKGQAITGTGSESDPWGP